MKSVSITSFFGVHRKPEHPGIASIKAKVRPAARSRFAVQPFWLYTSYVLIALNLVVMFSYFLGVNAQAATGYEIQKIQDKIALYTDQNKQLNLKVSEQASIAQIQNDFVASGYVPVSSPTYLQVDRFTYNK